MSARGNTLRNATLLWYFFSFSISVVVSAATPHFHGDDLKFQDASEQQHPPMFWDWSVETYVIQAGYPLMTLMKLA